MLRVWGQAGLLAVVLLIAQDLGSLSMEFKESVVGLAVLYLLIPGAVVVALGSVVETARLPLAEMVPRALRVLTLELLLSTVLVGVEVTTLEVREGFPEQLLAVGEVVPLITGREFRGLLILAVAAGLGASQVELAVLER